MAKQVDSISSKDKQINDYIESDQVVLTDTLAPYYDLDFFLHNQFALNLNDRTISRVIKMEDIVESLKNETELLAEYESFDYSEGVIDIIYSQYEPFKANEEEYRLVMKIARSLVAEQEPEKNDVDRLKDIQLTDEEKEREREEELLLEQQQQQQKQQKQLVNAKDKIKSLKGQTVDLIADLPACYDDYSFNFDLNNPDSKLSNGSQIRIVNYMDGMSGFDAYVEVSEYGDSYFVKPINLLKAIEID